MDNLELLFIIVNHSNERKIIKLINKYKIGFKFVMYGEGTASSSLLEYFDLNDEEKVIITSILPVNLAKQILLDLKTKINVEDIGKGIAFSIPLSSSIKYIKDYYQSYETEDVDMEETKEHLIITITNEGYAEKVMTEAKKKGATGGTTINGRGLESSKVIRLFNIAIEPEKDIVLILAKTENKNDIMNAIVESCGLKTKGAGICFSLPVDYAVGLNKEIDKL